MPITVNVLNTTSNYRTGIATCGIYFEKGEVTSTSQIITELGGIGYRDFGGLAYPQKVQWEPFGAPHSDGSYRFAKASFRVELDPNRERKVVMNVNGVGSTPNYISMPYDVTNLNIFNNVMFEFNFNGNYIYIPATQLTRIDTGDSEGCVRRYKLFTRPVAGRRSLWVEIVVDVPTRGVYDSQGNSWTANPITTANFWFRFGTSLIQRNTGNRNINGTYAQEQNNCYFTENVTLTIFGCDSIMRFPEHIYGSSNVGTSTAPTIRHILHNPNFPANNSNAMRGSASKMYRGVLFLDGETSSTAAERFPTNTSPEISAIAEGWARYMPPTFAEIPRPDNVSSITNSGHRNDWIARINTILQRGYGQIRVKPHQSSPYGAKPNVSGAGDQGVYGNAYHHNPLYWLMQTAYPKEIPYIINGVMSQCFRGQWFYEEDGTPFQYANYPGIYMWSSTPFDGNGTASDVSPDTMGIVWLQARAPQQKAGDPYNEWETYDREHSSCHGFAVAAILTADYFALEFCKLWAEVYGASVFGHTGNPTIDSWSADRASARTTQSLIPLYYATNSHAARVGIIKRYWQAKQTLDFWRNGVNARIDRVDFIEALKVRVPDGTTIQYILDVNAPTPGNLFSRTSSENPFFTPWQLSFVAVMIYQISKMFQDLYPNGAYLSNYQAGATINTTTLSLNDPGGNRVVVSKDTALSISRDLSATVIQHCTNFFGGGSEYQWDWIEMVVTGRPGLNARSLARLNECYPIGGTVGGQSSGTVGIIHHVEAGDVNANSNQNWPVRIWLRNCSGPGFQTNSAGFITEDVVSSTGYSSTPSTLGRSLAGWFGTVAYSFDVGGTSHLQRRVGTNYRVPQTKAQMEIYDTTRTWDTNILGAPVYWRPVKDYGSWQIACASICLEGVRDNYYSTGDEVNYPVSRLQTKAKAIVNSMISASSVEVGDWNQTVIPYIGLMSNWKDSGIVDVNVSTLIQSSAALAVPTLLTERFPVTEITPRQPVGVRLGSGALAYSYEIPQFTVFAEQATNIIIKPLAVTDTRKDNVQAIRIFIDYLNSIGIYDTGTAELLPVDVITTRKPVGAIINKIIYLAIGSPPPVIRPVGIVLTPDSTIPSEVEDPAIDYTVLPDVVVELPSF